MNKNIIGIGFAAVLIGGYAVYANFFMEKTAIGALCKADASCDGTCLAMGNTGQVCTRTCSGPADCPSPTSCQEINLSTVNAKGEVSSKGPSKYCLPGAPSPAAKN
jgi:hypothetical protein